MVFLRMSEELDEKHIFFYWSGLWTRLVKFSWFVLLKPQIFMVKNQGMFHFLPPLSSQFVQQETILCWSKAF